MKFSHGVWTMREGVTSTAVARVHEHEFRDGELVLRCVNRHEPKANINNYGFSLRLGSPLEGVIRVHVQHLTGRVRRGPDFEIAASRYEGVRVEVDGDKLVFRSGRISAVIKKNPFSLSFYDGERLLTRSKENQLAMMQVAGDREYWMQRLSLSVGEHVYGLGERFGPLAKNGQSISIWNEDPGTETDLAYKSIPFFLTNRGYGVLVNHPGRVDFEVATERVSALQFSVPGGELDYFVLQGPDPKGVLEKYAALTGRPPLPPLWSFGLWLSTSFLTDYDEKIVGGLIDGMFERQIPISVFHFDCLWMKEHHWCDFEWDKDKFPDAPAMLERLKQRGIKICVWINPYISEFSKLFAEGRDKRCFVQDKNGDVYQRNDWQPQIALIDFTNPQATHWYREKLRALLEMGVDCFKTDFGERIPVDAVYHDGSDPERMHNYYAYLYNRAVYSLLEEHRGVHEAVVFARSATVGSQKFPVHWGGDCDATFESMSETLRGGLSFGLSGGAFWSHDISGFNATASPTLYKRWVAFGLLSSHSRLHGSSSYRVPWVFDEESVDVLRHFTRLKMRLMPYVWGAAVQAHERGVPLLRATVLEYPDDPAALALEGQYLLGDSLLVAPVFDPEGAVRYYVPRGRWTDFETGEVKEGGRWYEELQVSMFRVPLLVRPGTLLPIGKFDDRPEYDFAQGLRLELFELDDGAEARSVVHGSDGKPLAEFRATRQGKRIQFVATAGRELTVLLRRCSSLGPIENGSTVETSPLGSIVAWSAANKPLIVELD
ncbi:MAG TPA: alpha-xylosidase [Polyangiaceae bacterium]|nr:alpha-xylosidase [Polyangiaceae bacterium]